jgi:ATP-dependent exoDNAse (exonuclease V) beta subunit
MDSPVDNRQRLEALDPGRSFIVQAPAGSGKTGLLVRRFLTLLSRAAAPEEILAITFTRKATAEMRDRLLAALFQAQTNDIPEPVDQEVVNLAKAVLKNDQRQRWNLLNNPRRLKILTIDAFCFELVKRMPWSARFGAAPGILEDQLLEDLYREAAKRALDHIEDRGSLSADCSNLVKLVDANFGKAQTLLATMLKKRDRWMRRVEIGAREEFEKMWRQVVESQLEKASRLLPLNLKTEIAFLARFAAGNPYQQNPNDALACCIDMAGFPDPVAESLAYWRGVCALLLTIQRNEYRFRRQVDTRIGFPATFKDEKGRMKSVLETLNTMPELLHTLSIIPILPDPEFNDRQWQTLASLLNILPVAAAELRLLFKENNQSDFIEINQRAEMALGGVDSPSDLALSFDHQVNHLLMDEVQDTSLAQIELLRKLTAGWQQGDGRTLFFVGDPMQSIYRFREAEVANFLDIQDYGIGEVRPESLILQNNFRSGSSLVNWYNQVFSAIFPARDDAVYSAVRYSPSVATRDSLDRSGVFLHPQLEGNIDSEAEAICTQLLSELRQDPNAEIGILGRNRSHLAAIARVLRQHGVHYQAIELEPLSQRPAVQDLMALTRGLVQPGDRIAWLSIFRAPWCGLSLEDISILGINEQYSTILEAAENHDEFHTLSQDGVHRISKTLDALRAPLLQRGRVSLRQNVEAAWLNLAGPACVDRSDLEDCESFLELLGRIEKDHGVITADILNNAVTRLWSRTDGKSKVQLLTIHKSKGLEFDVVFLPQLHRRPPAMDQELLRWTRLPEQLLIAVLPHSDVRDDRFYAYLGDLEKSRQRNELHRLLYVACTRSRQKLHLYMSIALNSKNEPRLPARNSMLELLWPSLETGIADNLTVESADTAQVESALPLTQFRRLPAHWPYPLFPEGIENTVSPVQTRSKPQSLDQIEFSWAGDSARITGIALHQMLQKIVGGNWIQWKHRKTESLLAELRISLLENGLGQENLSDAISTLRIAVENLKSDPRADWIFSDQHSQVKTEWPLTALIDNTVENVLIDRSFVDSDNNRWIIDFKSSSHEGGDNQWFLENEKQRYQQQLARYAEIVGKLEERKIKLGLYYPLLKGWCEWSLEAT